MRQDDVAKADLEVTQAEHELGEAVRATDEAKVSLNSALQQMNQGISQGTIDRESVESVRVTLKQGYLRKYIESDAVGEVAVLMTVKESRTGLGQQEPKSGRVVYYSEGARKNAFLNFRDQPVYGPIRYGGDDLQIRISVIELDETDNAVAGAMLKTIASIGSVAYPPSSPVLSALDQIGNALLTLNGPDLEWDYLMRLSSRPAVEPTGFGEAAKSWTDAWLRDGYYVLMRSDTSRDGSLRARIDQSVWDSLYLDPGTGVIYQRTDQSDGPPQQVHEYRAHSYLVFTVQTGFDSSQLDLAQEASELSAVLSAYGAGATSLNSASEAIVSSLQESLKSLKDRQRQKQKVRDLRNTAGARPN